MPNVYTLQHPYGTLAVQDNGFKRLLRFDPSPGIFAPYKSWETSYPFELIKLIFDVKGAWSLKRESMWMCSWRASAATPGVARW